MLIDWFTVVAQIVNFLILVALLKYFLYGRIIAAMDQRQEQINQRWQEAEVAKKKAEQEAASIQRKNIALDESREQLLAKIHDEVDEHRRELIGKARAEVDQLQTRWNDSLHEETDSFIRDLRALAAKEICSIARTALAELADQELEHCVVRAFIRRLYALNQDDRNEIGSHFKESGEDAILQSAFEIPVEQQNKITDVLKKQLFEHFNTRFELSEGLTCGIALQTKGHRIAWELSDFLDGLEQQILSTLEQESVRSVSIHHVKHADTEKVTA